MSLEVEMIAPGEIVTDISDRILLDGLTTDGVAFANQAEEGGVGASDIIIDDPNGDLYLVGGHGIRARETESESPDPYIYSGAFGQRRVIRGPYRTGASRQWRVSLVDGNSGLSRMVFRPTEDASRPAETAGERGAWLLTTVPMSNLTDHRYFDTTDTTPMDAADYTRGSALQVLQDMINQSGYDAGVIYAGDLEEYAPFYMAPDSDLLDSDLRLSNVMDDVLSDYDGNTAYLDLEAELIIDDDRVASGILGVGDGIEVFAQRNSTAVTFARRDKVMDAPHVKTLPVLRARVTRWLSDFDSEEVTATARVLLPPTKVSMLKAQYRVQVRATHWPGVEDWTWCRVLSATPEQVTSAGYLVAVELAMPKVAAPPATVRGVLQGTGGPYTTENGADLVHFANPGDSPGPGWPLVPTVGDIEVMVDASPPHPDRSLWGWKINGTGTVSARFYASFTGVAIDNIPFTITWAIRLNGAIVESEAQVVSGFLVAVGGEATITVTDLAVEPDDVLTATMSCVPPSLPFFRTPAGIGVSEQFEITDGSLT